MPFIFGCAKLWVLIISIVQQVTELGIELGPPLRHYAWRNGGVHVGRNVPIPGRRNLQATRAGRTDRRRKQSALSLVVECETHPRRIEDGHTLECDKGITPLTEIATVV